MSQAEDESTYAEFTALACHLADDRYLNHAAWKVRLLVACCIADILRIFAPEAPYKDPAQIKRILTFLIMQLSGLMSPERPEFDGYVYLLKTMAHAKSFNLCFELSEKECSKITRTVFNIMIAVIK